MSTSDKDKDSLVSMSGAPIYRHGEAAGWEPPKGEECIEQISAHIEAYLGKVDSVYHELVSDAVHIDVHFVKPTKEFPFARLVTSGMGDLPMKVPEGADQPRYVELMATLPEAFHTLAISPQKSIRFFAVAPLYGEEMELKLRSGADKLLDKLGRANVSDVIDPGRANAARKRFGWF